MQEKTVINALLQVRKEGGNAQVHAEALLVLRGIDLPPIPKPRPADSFRHAELKRLVLEALRDGPKTYNAIADQVTAERPSVSPPDARRRVSMALAQMKRAGLVGREGRLWVLVAGFATQTPNDSINDLANNAGV